MARLLQLVLFVTFIFCIHFNTAYAATSLKFNSTPINDIATVFFKNILKKDFVISPQLLSDSRLITININDIPENQLLQKLTYILKNNGIIIKEKDNIFYLDLENKQLQPDNLIATNFNKTDLNSINTQIESQIKIESIERTEKQKISIQRYYKPKNRSITYLAKIAKFTGADVADLDDLSPVLLYSSSDLTVLEKTREMLKTADLPLQSITIKAAVIEYSNTDTSNRSLTGVLTLLSSKLGLTYNAGSLLSNSITFKSGSLSAALSAIDGDTNFKYLANPVIKVLNGEKAKLIAGSEVPVRGQSVIDKNGNPVQSIEYKSSGVEFEVQPKINGDMITLLINQQLSNFSQTTTSNIDSPTLFKRQATTTLDITRGSLIMIAGLDETKDSKSSSGLFFLPKFLRSKNDTSSNSQIILLLEVLNEPVLNTPML